jgi:hypothetical protein
VSRAVLASAGLRVEDPSAGEEERGPGLHSGSMVRSLAPGWAASALLGAQGSRRVVPVEIRWALCRRGRSGWPERAYGALVRPPGRTWALLGGVVLPRPGGFKGPVVGPRSGERAGHAGRWASNLVLPPPKLPLPFLPFPSLPRLQDAPLHALRLSLGCRSLVGASDRGCGVLGASGTAKKAVGGSAAE